MNSHLRLIFFVFLLSCNNCLSSSSLLSSSSSSSSSSFISASSVFGHESTNNNNNDQMLAAVAHMSLISQQPKCPVCYSNNHLQRIVSCHRINDTQTSWARKTPDLLALPSYKCKCKYLREKFCNANEADDDVDNDPQQQQREASRKLVGYLRSSSGEANNEEVELEVAESDEVREDELESEYERESVDCLVAHVGMSINGHNYVFNKWISKEDCFNLCLRTKIRNGYELDCKSFEHWHKGCNAQAPSKSSTADQTSVSAEKTSRVCASLEMEEHESGFRKKSRKNKNNNHKHHHRRHLDDEEEEEEESLVRSRRASSRTDYCVLSNMTIQMAGQEFSKNIIFYLYKVDPR